jgi:hypothetical protein
MPQLLDRSYFRHSQKLFVHNGFASPVRAFVTRVDDIE